jgi:four helix bundle protein
MPNESIQDYRDLSVWQLGMEIAVDIYRLTNSFPSDEKYGLTSQLRRAAASVPANIAEGHARSSTKEYLQFLSISIGSIAEITTFIELAVRLGYSNESASRGLLDQLQQERRMLRGLQASLRKRISKK